MHPVIGFLALFVSCRECTVTRNLQLKLDGMANDNTHLRRERKRMEEKMTYIQR